jgi:hypothetical protein
VGHTGFQQAAAADPQAAAGSHASSSWLSRELASLYIFGVYFSVTAAALACGWAYGAVLSVTTFVGYAALALAGVATAVCLLGKAWEGVRWAYDQTLNKWAGLPEEEASNAKTCVTAGVYFVILFWATGWLTTLLGLVLPFCAPLLLENGSLFLYRFPRERYRDTYVPRRTMWPIGQEDSSLAKRLVYILRLGSVLVGRWSPADAHGFLMCCAAVAWLFAALGPRALLSFAAVALETASMLNVVHNAKQSCALLKRHWDAAVDSAQERDFVCANAIVSLMLAGLPVYKAGSWWYVLHYANTMCLVYWACTCLSCSMLLSHLLTVVADDAAKFVSKDGDLWGGIVFTVFMAHMLYVCWVRPWLVVPFISLCAALACSLYEGDTHSDGFPDRVLSPLGGSEDDEDDEHQDDSYDEVDDEEDDEDGSHQDLRDYMDEVLLRRRMLAFSNRIKADMNRWLGLESSD